MNKKDDKVNWSQHLAFVALKVLGDNDNKMELSDLLNEIEMREGASIPKDKKETYASGVVIWKDRVQVNSDIYVKAGFLRKSKGVWYLTDDGKKNIKDRDEKDMVRFARKKWNEYGKEKKEKQSKSFSDSNTNDVEESKLIDDTELHESNAISGIKEYIRTLGPYSFQDLCAALLRGMNYYVRYNATPGPDGGIDILAYTDPLGGRPPRLKVQVKHTSIKSGRDDLARLAGLLIEGDIGIFISSSGFASTCRDFARHNKMHLELIDLDRLIDLWKSHYDNLSEEDKALLPLYPIYFLDKKRAISE